jgi:hypothetical protein
MAAQSLDVVRHSYDVHMVVFLQAEGELGMYDNHMAKFLQIETLKLTYMDPYGPNWQSAGHMATK